MLAVQHLAAAAAALHCLAASAVLAAAACPTKVLVEAWGTALKSSGDFKVTASEHRSLALLAQQHVLGLIHLSCNEAAATCTRSWLQ